MIILIILVFSLSMIFYWKWIYVPKRVSKLLENVPGPKSYPLIASLPFILSKNWKFLNSEELLKRSLRASLKFGGIFKLWFANEPVVFLSNNKYIEALISSNLHLDKTDEYPVVTSSVGKDCLITMKAVDWRTRYKFVAPAFLHSDIVSITMISINKKFTTLLDILNDKMETSNEKKMILNIEPFVSKCALDIALEVVTGIDMKFQTSSHPNKDEISKGLKLGESSLLFERLFKPWLRFDFLWNLLPEGRKEQEYVRIGRNYTKPIIDAMIKAEIENIKNGDKAFKNEKNVSVFERLLGISFKGKTLNFKEIYDEINLLIIAAHDTVSCCFRFTIYLLAVNPEYQKLVYEELLEIFGTEKNPEFDKNHLSRMKYTEMCIKESLRVFPSIPLFARKLSSDLDLGDGIIIPAGISVALLAYALHRDPEIFENPEEFQPERFSHENCKGRSQYAYIPFSIGPRNCLGKRYAMMALKIGIGKLFLNFSFECETKREDLIISPSTALKSKKPIFCKLTKRD